MHFVKAFSEKSHPCITEVCSHLGEAGFLKSPLWIELEINNRFKQSMLNAIYTKVTFQ